MSIRNAKSDRRIPLPWLMVSLDHLSWCTFLVLILEDCSVGSPCASWYLEINARLCSFLGGQQLLSCFCLVFALHCTKTFKSMFGFFLHNYYFLDFLPILANTSAISSSCSAIFCLYHLKLLLVFISPYLVGILLNYSSPVWRLETLPNWARSMTTGLDVREDDQVTWCTVSCKPFK